MHPETQLQVARTEHHLRAVEASRVVSVLRAIAQRSAQRHQRSTGATVRGATSGSAPRESDAMPRWAM